MFLQIVRSLFKQKTVPIKPACLCIAAFARIESGQKIALCECGQTIVCASAVNNLKINLFERNFMENQHRKISGYRELCQDEIDLMNEGKALAERVGQWIEKTSKIGIRNEGTDAEVKIDHRWLSIGKSHLQQGFMAAIRAIAKPTTF
ncbi:DUF7681 family protein [Undibacterium sp. SXout11W]|uniref:Acb2/Tad1 domain-containing protein n=1 Tax=Undibacterium sp. SXout11W TaxID=3413050 RepID=UPI003BF1537D